MPPARVVQVSVKGTLHGVETVNVLNFGTDTVNPNYVQLCLDIIDCIRTALRPGLTSQWKLNKLVARELYPVLADPIDVYPTTELIGSGLPGLPSFVAALITLNTGGGGRSGRGRIFIAGVVANDTASGRILTGNLAPFTAFLTCMAGKFINQVEPAVVRNFQWGVLSRKNAGVSFATANTAFRNVTSTKVSDLLATMHSRKIGVGS